MALLFGFLLNPLTQEATDLGDAVTLGEQAAGRWLGMAVVLFFASVCLTLGLTAVVSPFDERAARHEPAPVSVCGSRGGAEAQQLPHTPRFAASAARCAVRYDVTRLNGLLL